MNLKTQFVNIRKGGLIGYKELINGNNIACSVIKNFYLDVK